MCITNSTIIRLGPNSGLHGERPATNPLSTGMVGFLRRKSVRSTWAETVEHAPSSSIGAITLGGFWSKAIPLQAWTGRESSRSLRLPNLEYAPSCMNLLLWFDRKRRIVHGCYLQMITHINSTNLYLWTLKTSLFAHLSWLLFSKLLHKPCEKLSHFKNKVHNDFRAFEYIQTSKYDNVIHIHLRGGFKMLLESLYFREI